MSTTIRCVSLSSANLFAIIKADCSEFAGLYKLKLLLLVVERCWNIAWN